MKEELRSFLRSLQYRNENGDEFVTFSPKRRELFWRNNLSVHEKLKPVGGLFQLPKRIATLRDKLRPAAFAICLAIVCAHGS
jgi:hypothetical protein